ncbi:hypothetical protein SE17_17875 [Kouleothrix aurantiaca]|uniref:Uncharacterized protein n=1 Tax=Kouleothrix aurantiaca TaxID=186479 RepID=A0A0P9DPJ6_9CHLR|nr:hypothetical protein SE17_17875 [Kouleothrix aurantiaca]
MRLLLSSLPNRWTIPTANILLYPMQHIKHFRRNDNQACIVLCEGLTEVPIDFLAGDIRSMNLPTDATVIQNPWRWAVFR